jgi:hypothetical protein
MAKKLRGGTHTTLTETAALVVSVLERIPGVTMISPGIITKSGSRTGKRYITAVFTNAGMELIISGQSIQKVAVHCAPPLAPHIFATLRNHKKLQGIIGKTRERRPGI